MRTDKGKHGAQKLAAGIFTAVMVLLCAALYFFTGKERLGGKAGAYGENPAPRIALVTEQDFLADKSHYAPDGEGEYLLSAEAAEGTLSFSSGERGVSSFLLRVSRPEAPEKPGEKAGVLEAMLYEERLEAYDAQKAWIKAEALSLLSVLDAGSTLTQADREAFLFALDSTITDGKSRSLTFSELSVDIHFYQSGEAPLAVAAARTGAEDAG